MVEGGISPASGFVTRLARQGEPSRVRVILFVAVRAFADRIRLGRGLVTFLAVHIHVFAVQFEGGLVVVKCGGSPRVHAVTRQTVRAEAAFVRLVLPMTGETVPRRGLQVRQFARVGMTGITIHFHVRARQGKGDLAVVEVFGVGIHAIVTGETVTAPGRQMGIGEIGIQPAVTVHASRGIETGQVLHMAIFADEWLIRVGQFMTCQRIFHHVVRKFRPRRSQRKRSGRATMFGVTVLTTKIRIIVIHLAMRLGDPGHVGGQVGVTVRATVRHPLRRPGCNVTGFAIAQRGRVRRDAVDFRLSLRIERTRREHAISARRRNSHDHRQREKRGDDRAQGKTSKAVIFHTASP